MKKTGIFYGSTTGTTKDVALQLASRLDIHFEDVHDVANTAPDAVSGYDFLIMGTSTWGAGDMQDDWYDFVPGVSALDLTGKEIALYGVGDESMSDTFCDGLGELRDRLAGTGAKFVGQTDTEGYEFNKSRALHDGKFVGLVLDEVNKPEVSELKLTAWADAMKVLVNE
jgi:flavodoxin I